MPLSWQKSIENRVGKPILNGSFAGKCKKYVSFEVAVFDTKKKKVEERIHRVLILLK
jgi:hypothetical protein